MRVGSIIQFMIFMIIILVMAKVMGFADNGTAVLAACGIGGAAYVLIFIISTKLHNWRATRKEEKSVNSDTFSKKKNKKKNPNKKKSGTA